MSTFSTLTKRNISHNFINESIDIVARSIVPHTLNLDPPSIVAHTLDIDTRNIVPHTLDATETPSTDLPSITIRAAKPATSSHARETITWSGQRNWAPGRFPNTANHVVVYPTSNIVERDLAAPTVIPTQQVLAVDQAQAVQPVNTPTHVAAEVVQTIGAAALLMIVLGTFIWWMKTRFCKRIVEAREVDEA